MDFMWPGIALVGLALVLIGGLLYRLGRTLQVGSAWPICICNECLSCGCQESWRHHGDMNEIQRLP